MTVPSNEHVQSMVNGALAGLPDDASESVKIATAQAATTTAVAAIPPPSGPAVNVLWIILVGALSLVVIGSAIIAGVYALQNKKAPPEIVITIFTTSLSGLLGFFAKSPSGK